MFCVRVNFQAVISRMLVAALFFFFPVFLLVFFLVFFCWASSVSQMLTPENAGLAFVETRFRYAAYLADVSLHPDDSRKSPTWIPIAAILMALCAIGLALTLLGLL
jgi:hypothetical protein